MAVKTSERGLSEAELYAPDLDEGQEAVERFALPDGGKIEDPYVRRVWDEAVRLVEEGMTGEDRQQYAKRFEAWPDDDDEPEQYAKRKSAPGQGSLFSEADHPRDADGKFAEKGTEGAAETVPGLGAQSPPKQVESTGGQQGLFGEDSHAAKPKANPYVDMFQQVGADRQDTFWHGMGDKPRQGQLFEMDKARAESKPSPEQIEQADALIREPQSPEEMPQLFEAVRRHPYYTEVKRRLAEYGPNVTTWSQRQNQDEQGHYTPERTALHEEIVGRMLNPKAAAPQGQRPVAFLLMGPPAAGKTTAGAPMSKRLGVEFTVINPDDAKAALPEYEGWNAAILHEESSYITEDLVYGRAVAARHNLQFDLTGKNDEKLARQADTLAELGYDIHVVHVKLPSEKAAYRAWNRFRKGAFATEGEPGRFVEPEYSGVDVDEKPDRTYARLKEHPSVRSWMQVSTDVPKGQQPKVLDEGGDTSSPKKSDSALDSQSENARLNSSGETDSSPKHEEGGRMKFDEVGQWNKGDRFQRGGKWYEAGEVRREYWSQGRIDDEDEFGREPGWYSTFEAQEVEPTAQERETVDRDAGEQAAKRDAKAKAISEWKARLASLRSQMDGLIAEHGLQEADSRPTFPEGTTKEEIGGASEPDRGPSGQDYLTKYVGPDGEVLGVSFGPAVDMPPRFWVSEGAKRHDDSHRRVHQWWNPKQYGPESYPGPGVPRGDLTPDELRQVEGYESAKREFRKSQQVSGWGLNVQYHANNEGEVIEEADRIVVRVPEQYRQWFDDQLAHQQKLAADPFYGSRHEMALPVVIETIPSAKKTRGRRK